MTQIWPQGSKQSWLGLCMVTWLLLPRTLGLRRFRKASDSLYHSSDRLLVSGGLPHLSLSPGCLGRYWIQWGPTRELLCTAVLPGLTHGRQCFPKPSFCAFFMTHPQRMAGTPLILGSKTWYFHYELPRSELHPQTGTCPPLSLHTEAPRDELIPSSCCSLSGGGAYRSELFILLMPQMIQEVECHLSLHVNQGETETERELRKPALGLWHWRAQVCKGIIHYTPFLC